MVEQKVIVAAHSGIGMSDKDAAELVKHLYDTTPYSKDDLLFSSHRSGRSSLILAGVDAGIAMVEREADHFAPSIKTSILLACARAKKMEG